MLGLGRHLLVGAGWMISARFADRAIGLASTAILARLLLPQDFGLVALAVSLIGILDMVSEFSVELVLIQNQDADHRHYDTAWTLNILKGIVLAVVLLLLAVPAAQFFREPRVTAIVGWLALMMFIGGFENIGVVDFRKHLEFHREFIFVMSSRVIGTLVTVTWAFVSAGPYALVAGMIGRRVIALGLSFVLQAYRPRLSLVAFTELFRFSRWVMLENVLNAFRQRSANFVLGRVAGAQALGLYSMAYELAMMASSEIEQPIRRAVFPGYAKVASDPAALRSAFLDVFAMIAMVAAPVAVGMGLVAPLVVPILLGPRWLDAIPLVQILSACGLIIVLGGGTRLVYLALNKPYVATLMSGADALMLLPLTTFGALKAGPIGVAWAMVGTAAVTWLIAMVLVMRFLNIHLAAIASRLWRVLLGLFGMGVAVGMLPASGTGDAWPGARLVVSIMTGVISYVFVVVGAWVIAGRPDGAESHVAHTASKLLRRLIRSAVADSAAQPSDREMVRFVVFRTGTGYPRLERFASRVAWLRRLVAGLARDSAARRTPRSRQYMEKLAAEKIPDFDGSRLIVIDDAETNGKIDWSAPDEIVLLWPDANGTGWGDLERKIFARKQYSARVIVVNGRRRCFVLDRARWRAVRARRLLEKSLIMEVAFLGAFIVLTPWLLAWDVVRERR
jgi:O-antigen/teichoic acid export membrane protein